MDSSYGQVVQALLDAISSGMISVSEGLVPLGTRLWFYLSVISIGWYGIKVMLESGVIVDVLGEFMRTLFMIAIAWGLMQEGLYVLIFKDFIGGFFDDATRIISTQLGFGGNFAETLVGGMSKLIGFASEAGKSLNEQFGKVSGPIDFVVSLGANVVTMLFIAAAMVITFLAACVYFAVGFISMILVSIAHGAAPLIIPCLVWEYTRKWFDGFLTYIVTANLYKVVGALMLGVTSIILDHMVSVINTTALSGDYGKQALAAIFVAAISVVILMLMWQVPSIAHGLISGSGGLSVRMPRQKPSGSSSPSPGQGAGGGGASGKGGKS